MNSHKKARTMTVITAQTSRQQKHTQACTKHLALKLALALLPKVNPLNMALGSSVVTFDPTTRMAPKDARRAAGPQFIRSPILFM